MVKARILREDDRVELIDGEVIEMAPVGSRHVACVNDLTRSFVQQLGDRATVSIQNPVRLSSGSEPQPDLSILRPRTDRYREAVPATADVLLLIEVSDTTLPFDRGVKLPLYAESGIPEVWIADLSRRGFLVHRQPEGRAYREVAVVKEGMLSPLALPDVLIDVRDVLE